MNKKRVDKLAIILAAACLLLAAGLVGLAFVFRGRQNRYEEVKKQLEKKKRLRSRQALNRGNAGAGKSWVSGFPVGKRWRKHGALGQS